MNNDRVILAFSGSPASSAAVRWLMDERHADVVALVVDVGQLDDLEEVQTRAVACGAIRAHVVDRCDAFARDVIAPAMASSTPLGREALAGLAHSTIAAALVEVATIEGTRTVAHASADDGLDEHIARLRPTLRVIAPAREWTSQGVDVADYVRTRRLSPGTARIERHLLIRKPASTASGCEAAQVTIGFENGIAAYVNGVSMGLSELIESLSLIGSRYGLAEGNSLPAPAVELLQAAYAASGGNDVVTVLVRCGSIAVTGPA
ncbi:MAG TPA: argininosuccinate synthase domain-containing protein [Vicinamibacterales bacterium]|nr:argininosuccinate synthase domain-containing protein [Vicinamibacterales bacterium]